MAVTAIIGVIGVWMCDPQTGLALQRMLLSTFLAGLSVSVTSWCRGRMLDLRSVLQPLDERALVRQAARPIYVVLYVLAAARLTEFLGSAGASGISLEDSMHSLWPYYLGALVPLVLLRLLAARCRHRTW